MRSKSDKVQLSFNAGEYSSFLDSRVDIDKASSAARKMRNFVAEVGGTARRRPGLRFVLNTTAGLPEPSASASGEVLTNYVEFPFWQFLHWRADPVNTGVAYGLYYRGVVRMWESGTVQMIGEMQFHDGTPTTSLSEISYKVWFGETGQPGSLQTVATIPTDGAWHDVDWAGKPGALEHCEVIYGGTPTNLGDIAGYIAKSELWKYPDGLVVPPDPDVWGGSAGGVGITACSLVRNGNNIDGDSSIAPGAFTTQHFIAKVDLDYTTWTYANAVAYLNASTLFGSIGATFSATIPDSASVGLRILIWTANQNVNNGTFDMGPFFRLAYAPTIQQGVDPQP